MSTSALNSTSISSQKKIDTPTHVSRQKSYETGAGKYQKVAVEPTRRAFNPLIDTVVRIDPLRDPRLQETALASAKEALRTYSNQIKSHPNSPNFAGVDIGTPAGDVLVALTVLQSVQAQEFHRSTSSVHSSEETHAFFEQNSTPLRKVIDYFLKSHRESLKLSDAFPEKKEELQELFSPINASYQQTKYGTAVSYSRQEISNNQVQHTTTTQTQSSALQTGGSQLERLEYARWHTVLTKSSLAYPLLTEYRTHLESKILDIEYSNITDVKAFSDAIFASNRLAYSEYFSSHQTGSFSTTFFLNDKVVSSVFFAANGVIESASLGASIPHFGYASSNGFRIIGTQTANSVSVIVAEVIGSDDSTAKYGIEHILNKMGTPNSDQFLPFNNHDLLETQGFVNDVMNQSNSGAHISVVTWWRGAITMPHGTERREPFLSVVHLGPGIHHVTSSAGMYEGDPIPVIAPRSIFRAAPSEPQSWTTMVPIPRKALGQVDRWFSYEPQTYVTSFQGTNSKWSIVTSKNFPISDKDIIKIADRYENYPIDHIAREVLNAAGGEGFCVIGRLNGAIPRSKDSSLNLNFYKGSDYWQLPRTSALPEPGQDNIPLLRARRPGAPLSASEDQGLFPPGLHNRVVRLGTLSIAQCEGPVDTFKLRGSTMMYGATATTSSFGQDPYTPTRLPAYSSSPYINWTESNATYLAQQFPWHAYPVFGPHQKNPNLSTAFIKATQRVLVHFAGRNGITGSYGAIGSDYFGMFVSGSGGSSSELGNIHSPVFHPAHAISLQLDGLLNIGQFGLKFALTPGASYRDEILTASTFAAIPHNNEHKTQFVAMIPSITLSFSPVLLPHVFGLGGFQVINVSRERAVAGPSDQSPKSRMYFGKDATGNASDLTEKSTWASDLNNNTKGLFAVVPSKTLQALGGPQQLSQRLKTRTLGPEGSTNAAQDVLNQIPFDSSRPDGLMLLNFS